MKPRWDPNMNDKRFLRGLAISSEGQMDQPGVSFTPPPKGLMAEATRIVDEMAAQLPDDAKGGIVGVATEKGVNFAVVQRAGKHFATTIWIGKSWGEKVTGGGGIKASW